MHRTLTCFAFLFILASATSVMAQKSEGGSPYSGLLAGLKSNSTLPAVKLKELDIKSLIEEEGDGHLPVRYGIFTDTILNIKEKGKSDIIPGQGRIWRLRVENRNAKSIQLFFRRFVIPEGARLFLYNENQEEISGAFTKRNLQRDSTFMAADFKGNHVIIEYFEPEHPEFQGEMIIGAIGQAYKDLLSAESGPEFININCPIGKDVQLAKHAVARMSYRSGTYQVSCSGALINNTKNDGTPYFLTANHCLSNQDEASTLNLYFNYEIAGCGGDTLVPQILGGGSTLLTTGQPSDFSLLLLNEVPQRQHQPYYAGWNITDDPGDEFTGIHVPFANTKKISIDRDSIFSNDVSISWKEGGISPEGSHWVVNFEEGLTSPGSSGSPLFNAKNQIIGQLHGGNDDYDFYGMLSYTFSHKPNNYPSMGHYLDPDNTGIKEIDGYFPADNMPDAFFTSQFEHVCVGSQITFTDFSVFGPSEKLWTITPPDCNFVEGTSDTSDNPTIQFLSNSEYTIRLDLITQGEVESSETLTISAGNTIIVDVEPVNSREFCDCEFESIPLIASGADFYSWDLNPEDMNKITLTNGSGNAATLSRIADYKPDSNYYVNFRLIGNQSICSDTINVSYKFLLSPENDSIENAILLDYGKSELFSNICGTIEEDEPIPPFTSCVTQDSWCDEYGTGKNIVENSVWFKFSASPTGRVSISSSGFDNQIALYEADSYIDILNGEYVLLGANDDRTVNNFRPMIISEFVIPGAIYWIQVDGSGGGLEDEFDLTINELSEVAVEDALNENIRVFPQPASSFVHLQNPEWSGSEAQVSIYSTSGVCLLNDIIVPDNHRITLDISLWESGIYIAVIKTDHLRYISKIVKK